LFFVAFVIVSYHGQAAKSCPEITTDGWADYFSGSINKMKGHKKFHVSATITNHTQFLDAVYSPVFKITERVNDGIRSS
jgi:NADH:ubiquinone oxidoreductase subunit F (NADH-binding)